MSNFENKVAIVTGAASGIGLASAKVLKEKGATVILSDINEEELKKEAGKLGCDHFKCDVSSARDWDSFRLFVESKYHRVDLLHLNAGTASFDQSFPKFSLETYEKLIGTNIGGVMLGFRAFVDLLAKGATDLEQSNICVTASLAGIIAFSPDPIYTATKHAVVGFVRASANKLKERNIRINAICPTLVNTNLINQETKDALRKMNIDLLEPEDVANALLFILENDFTGKCIVCQVGLDPLIYEFRGVPGPRGEGTVPPSF